MVDSECVEGVLYLVAALDLVCFDQCFKEGLHRQWWTSMDILS